MSQRTEQRDLIAPDTALTISGGTTPSVTGPAINVSDITSPISLFLVNDLTSDDLTVTYEIGFVDEGDEDKAMPTITWVTPADGGAVSDMTAKDCNASECHASISVAVAKYYRFIVTNNSAGKTAQVSLFGVTSW